MSLENTQYKKTTHYYFTGSAGQQRVSANFFENFVIPLPSIKKQEEICDRIFSKKREIKRLRLNIKSLREDAKRMFELEVFGE